MTGVVIIQARMVHLEHSANLGDWGGVSGGLITRAFGLLTYTSSSTSTRRRTHTYAVLTRSTFSFSVYISMYH